MILNSLFFVPAQIFPLKFRSRNLPNFLVKFDYIPKILIRTYSGATSFMWFQKATPALPDIQELYDIIDIFNF